MDEMALQSKKMDDISAKKGPKSLGQGELAAAIASGESDSCGGYDAFNITTSSKVTHSSREGDKIEGKKLSEYSLGEMLKLSKQSTTNVTDKNGKTTKYSGKLWAAGRYQVTAATLHGKMYSSGNGIRQGTKEFGPNTLFDQVAQDICYEYIINKSRLPVHNYLYGNGSIDAAAKSLAQCWASIGVKGTNKSYYAGDGMNGTMAHTKYETIIKALKADKAAIERGDLASATMQPNVKGDDTPVVKDNPVVVSDEGEKKAAEPVIGKGNIKLKTDPNLRIRDKASRDGSNVIGRIANGAEFEYTKEENGWLRIRSGAGYGWICKQYTSLYVAPATSKPSSSGSANAGTKKTVVDNASGKKVTVESGRYITSNGVVIRSAAKDSAKAIALQYRSNGKLVPRTELKKGMSVTVEDGVETDSAGNVWTKVSHYNRNKKYNGWIKNLESVSDTNAIIGDPEEKAKGKTVGNKKGVGLAKTVVEDLDKSSAGLYACQAYVADVTKRAIGQRVSAATAQDAWKNWAISADYSNMPIGAAVYFTSVCSSDCGHVGVHIGNGVVAHQVKNRVRQPLSEMTKENGFRFRGWGWNGGVKLKQPDEE
jgi:hypothetical protein